MSVQRLALTAALVTFSAGPLFAARPPPTGFPPVGTGIGQTLRLNAVASNPGPAQAPAAGCDATLSFADRNGNPTGPAPLVVSLMPGQAAFLDMPSGLTRPGRVEVEPMITFPAAGGGTDCDFSTELFDQASGFSSIFSRPPPQNLPGDAVSFSLMGLGIAQVAQLNVVAVQPGPTQTPASAAAVGGPCVVTLGFVDAAGTPAGVQPGPVQVTPGQTTSAYFLSTVRSVGGRMGIRPVETVDSLPGMKPCAGVASIVEIWDLITDRT